MLTTTRANLLSALGTSRPYSATPITTTSQQAGFRMSKTICSYPQCGAITDGGRCSLHRTDDNPRRNHTPRRKVYDSKRWKRCRAIVLNRDGYTCAMCGAEANTVDHWPVPVGGILAQGGDPCDPATCRSLCRSCHGRIDGKRGAGSIATITPTRLAGTSQSVRNGAKRGW